MFSSCFASGRRKPVALLQCIVIDDRRLLVENGGGLAVNLMAVVIKGDVMPLKAG